MNVKESRSADGRGRPTTRGPPVREASDEPDALAALTAFRSGDRGQLDERERSFERLLNALPTALYTTDAEGRLTFFNDAAAELAGRRPKLGHDSWCVTWKLFRPDGRPLPLAECPMAVTLKEDRPIRGVEVVAERPDGSRAAILPFPTPLHDASGRLVGAVNVLVDISERKAAESRQRMLIDELNHRVKNNLQMLAALLGVAERESENAEAKAVLMDAAQRIAAVGAAQRVLYDAHDPINFDSGEFLKSVCETAGQLLDDRVAITRHVTLAGLSNDVAMPLALILNELIANAAKHGRDRAGRASIDVGLTSDAVSQILYVRDRGPGFRFESARRRASGLGLVIGLARQLGGDLEVHQSDGACCVVRFGDPRAGRADPAV